MELDRFDFILIAGDDCSRRIASSRYRRWRNRNSDGTFVTEYDQQVC